MSATRSSDFFTCLGCYALLVGSAAGATGTAIASATYGTDDNCHDHEKRNGGRDKYEDGAETFSGWWRVRGCFLDWGTRSYSGTGRNIKPTKK
jgi:hypothetical protein